VTTIVCVYILYVSIRGRIFPREGDNVMNHGRGPLLVCHYRREVGERELTREILVCELERERETDSGEGER
jgi:hypothetical protein